MGFWRSLMVFLLGVFLLAGTSLSSEDPEALKAQIEALKQQMLQMQQQMQAQIEALQKKLEQVQAKAAAPQVVAPKGTPVFSKPNTEWLIYGKIKTDFHYDTAQFRKYNDFLGAVENRARHDDYKNDSTNFNPRDTRFGFWAAHKEGNWLVKGRFEIDFYGDNNGNNLIPRMRLAYSNITNVATKTSLLVGQDWIPVAALNPSTIDFGILTAAGNLWWRVPQITLRQKAFNNFEFLVSLMKHRRTDTANEDRMPWLLGRIAYTGGILGDGNMIAIGGGYRHADYGKNSSSNDDRYLVAGEWKFYFFDKRVLFKGEAWYGKGIGRNFLRYDLDQAPDGSMAEAYGGWADLTWRFAPRWSATIGAGFDNPNNGDMPSLLDMNDRQFTKNTQYYANVWYNITKPLKVGFEFIHVETERYDNTDTGNRFTFSMQYLF
jgi:hypothetical protein